MNLTLKDLVDRLRIMPAGSIRQVGRRVRGAQTSAADEIAWWGATVRVERLVRRQNQRLAAARAASAASRAVKQAALVSGLALDDPDVVATARAASDAASALVAGRGARAETGYFIDRLGPSFMGATSSASLAV